MKKLLGIVVLSLFMSTSAFAFGSVAGKGEIKLSEKTADNFVKYMNHVYSETFIVSQDGELSRFSKCQYLFYTFGKGCSGGPGNTRTMIKHCKEHFKKNCYVFAKRKKTKKIDKKIIVWNKINYEFHLTPMHGTNFVDEQKPWIIPLSDKPRISKEEIIKILKENNFY